MPRRGRWSQIWRRKGSTRSGQIQGVAAPAPPVVGDTVVTNGGVDTVVTNGTDVVTTNN